MQSSILYKDDLHHTGLKYFFYNKSKVENTPYNNSLFAVENQILAGKST